MGGPSSIQGKRIGTNPKVAQVSQHTLIDREQCLEQVLGTAEVKGAVEGEMAVSLCVNLATSTEQ